MRSEHGVENDGKNKKRDSVRSSVFVYIQDGVIFIAVKR